MDKLLLRPYVIECELHVPSQSFFFYHSFQTYKTKNITITRYYYIFPVPGKKGEKIKLSEIEVKTIIKMKKHNL